jgi:hypothetical protein
MVGSRFVNWRESGLYIFAQHSEETIQKSMCVRATNDEQEQQEKEKSPVVVASLLSILTYRYA